MQIRDAVVKQPRLLGMSLERRLVPRWQELHRAGVTPAWHSHHQVRARSDYVARRVFPFCVFLFVCVCAIVFLASTLVDLDLCPLAPLDAAFG